MRILFALFLCSCQLLIASSTPSVKVLIEKKAPGALIEIRGACKLHNPGSEKLISSHITDKRYYLFPHNRGIKWGDAFSSLYQIRFSPESLKSSILVDGIQYKGAIEVYNIDDVVNIVNEVDTESFLASYLSNLFPEEMDKEVMDAITIVARTNAYSLRARNEKAFWHFDADDINYQGHALTKSHLHVDEALSRTRYMVMTLDGEPFPTCWTQNSAGHTANYSAIYRKELPAPKGVPTSYAGRDRERHKWFFTISRDLLAQMLGKAHLKEIELYKEEESKKVYALKISDTYSSEAIPYITLQKVLGNNLLKSNDFSINPDKEDIVFTGYGEGTGVGLCLYNALFMAEKGAQAPDILKELFPGTKLQKIEHYPN